MPWVDRTVFGVVCALVMGVFAWRAEPGFLELLSPHPKDSYYNLLVQGFRSGQLNVKREAPSGLAQLADPYNPALNDLYVWDLSNPSYEMSYYRGKLYLYFGITPALVLFWPWLALSGHYLRHTDAVVIFCALGFLVAAGLLRAVWRRYFAETSIWAVAAGVLAVGLATGTLEALPHCDVYEVAKSCGFAFTMLALAAIWCALHQPNRRTLWLALASLAYGLAIGSRPSLLFGAIILLAPVALAWRAATEPGSRRRVGWLLMAAVGPVTLIGLGLMLYNGLRFGSPFEFGWHYQLTDTRNTGARQFSLRYLWFNLWFYFVEPNRWGGHFPFLQAGRLSVLPSNYYGAGEPYCGILSNCPLAWLALAAPLAWKGRSEEEVSALRWFVRAVFLLFAACALTLCLFFSGSSAYLLDFLPALMLLATIGILGLERALAGSPVWRRAARSGWCLLLAWSLAFNVLAGVKIQAAANYVAGNCLCHLKRLDQAVEHYQKALALEPESAVFHGGLGDAYEGEGRSDEAIDQYRQALTRQPDLLEGHVHLGNALLQKGESKEGLAEFQTAVNLQPENARVRDSLASALARQGKVAEALVEFGKAVSLDPNLATAHFNFGLALLLNGQTDDAQVQFQRAVYLRPDLADGHISLAQVLLQKGRVDEAIVHYEKTLEIQPTNVVAHSYLAHALLQTGRIREAIEHYEAAIRLQPNNPFTLNNLAWVLANGPDASLRNGTRAVALAQRAAQGTGNGDPLILETLATAYGETGQFEQAVAAAQQAQVLARTRGNQKLAGDLEQYIASYRAGKPYREQTPHR